MLTHLISFINAWHTDLTREMPFKSKNQINQVPCLLASANHDPPHLDPSRLSVHLTIILHPAVFVLLVHSNIFSCCFPLLSLSLIIPAVQVFHFSSPGSKRLPTCVFYKMGDPVAPASRKHYSYLPSMRFVASTSEITFFLPPGSFIAVLKLSLAKFPMFLYPTITGGLEILTQKC